MLELKFFKELPIRSLNQNHSFVEVKGADLYLDKEGNRYAFISYKNSYKKPVFSLYLHIKEYDSSGTFIKEDRFSLPTLYGATGLHVINTPIPLENSCDGVEVFVYFAEYNKYNFYNDKFVKQGFEMTEPTSLMNAKTTAKMPGFTSGSVKSPTLERKQGVDEYEEDEIVEDAAYIQGQAQASVKSKKSIFALSFIPFLLSIIGFIVVFMMSGNIEVFISNL